MSTLASWIVDLSSTTQLQRQSFEQIELKERDLDELVVKQHNLLANLLVENDLMEGSSLRYIGRQFHDVDVLFAEVDEEDEPLRLVLVENKLLKNPEAKRRVIGQIIEYAARFQETVTAEGLANRFPEHKEWVDQNAELLNRQLQRGDFLLVICGDGIHANLADIVGRLARRADRHPTSGMQLALVSMALYVGGAQRLLVPHVVGLVARAERQLEISVIDERGEPLKATVKTQAAQGRRSQFPKGNRTEDEFFRTVWAKKFGQQVVDDWYAFADQVREAEVPGLSFSTTLTGRPSLELRSAVLDAVLPVLRPRKSAPGVRDVVDSRAWNRNPKVVEARERFRSSMRQIPEASLSANGTVSVPMKSLRTESPRLISAIRQLAEDLDSA